MFFSSSYLIHTYADDCIGEYVYNNIQSQIMRLDLNRQYFQIFYLMN